MTLSYRMFNMRVRESLSLNDEMLFRRVGELIELSNGDKVLVVASDNCTGCYYHGMGRECKSQDLMECGLCSKHQRGDRVSVKFVKKNEKKNCLETKK